MKQKFVHPIETMVKHMFLENGSEECMTTVQATQLGAPALKEGFKALLGAIKKHVPSYNGFDGAKVVAFLTKKRRQIFTVRFAREGSPAIYVRLMERNDTEENRKTAHAFLLEADAELGADECSMKQMDYKVSNVFENGKRLVKECEPCFRHEIRLWWD